MPKASRAKAARSRPQQPRTSIAGLPLTILLSLKEEYIHRLADHVVFAQLSSATFALYRYNDSTGQAFWRDALLRLHLGRCELQEDINDGERPSDRALAFGFVWHARMCDLTNCRELLARDLRDCIEPRFWEPGMEASEDGARDDGDEAASESTSATPPTRFSAAAGHLEWPYWSKIDEAGFRQYISPSRFYVELRPIIEHVVAASAFATSPPVHEVYFYEDHARIGFPIANRDGVTLYDLVKTLCDRLGSETRPRYRWLFNQYRRAARSELKRRGRDERLAIRQRTDPDAATSDSDEATSDPDEEPADTNQTLYDFEDLLLSLHFKYCELSTYPDGDLSHCCDLTDWFTGDLYAVSSHLLRRAG